MNHHAKDPSGRILRHGQPADEVTAEAIETRARELALIDGRHASQVTDEDRRQSRAELLGQTLPATTQDDAESAGGMSRDPADPLSRPGRAATEQQSPDEQELAERLALEGVEEAQHDQMLAARREERRHP
ncbi:MAG: hypothetical protein ABII82_06290 [Verrucomicrobiota bacterium]